LVCFSNAYALPTSYLCHILGVRGNQTEARIGGRASIVSLKFEKQGAGPLSWNFEIFRAALHRWLKNTIAAAMRCSGTVLRCSVTELRCRIQFKKAKKSNIFFFFKNLCKKGPTLPLAAVALAHQPPRCSAQRYL
jgi:hypothetical protein